MLGCVSGCESDLVPVGPSDGPNGPLAGDWSSGVLGVNLDQRVSVMDVAAAAESVLMRLGYSVTSRSVTSRSASLVGSAPSGRSPGSVQVFASPTGISTRVEVVCPPFGNLGASREVLDAILAKLGAY